MIAPKLVHITTSNEDCLIGIRSTNKCCSVIESTLVCRGLEWFTISSFTLSWTPHKSSNVKLHISVPFLPRGLPLLCLSLQENTPPRHVVKSTVYGQTSA